jgi:cytochrome c biogenesis protein CcmG, thiol:disulfide interchange protein DsbE
MSQEASKMKLNRIWIPSIAVVALIGGWVAFGGSTGSSDASAEAVDLELVYLDGTTGELADFRGTPVVLNFWASWCPACIAELPDFEQVSQKLDGEVVFIGMNMQEVDRAAADALIAETGVTFRLADDPEGDIFRSFAGIGMPTTVFIDAEGAVANVHAGAVFAEDLEGLIDQHLLG